MPDCVCQKYLQENENEKKKENTACYPDSTEDEERELNMGKLGIYPNDSFQMKSGFRKCCNCQAWKCELPWCSGLLKNSALKAAEVNRGRAGHGDLISVLGRMGRVFSI